MFGDIEEGRFEFPIKIIEGRVRGAGVRDNCSGRYLNESIRNISLIIKEDSGIPRKHLGLVCRIGMLHEWN